MNYKKSAEILKEIKKAKRVLINCHRSPDPDGAGSSLALYQVIKNLGKEVKVVSPSNLHEDLKFLPHSEAIKKINFKKFKFDGYDLFICLDSADSKMVTGEWNIQLPKIPIVNIDHHKTNSKYGKINLVDSNVSSVSEILFLVLEDWGVRINKNLATLLLSGILCDTGVFQYPAVTKQTLEIAIKLIETGANKNEIISQIYRSYKFNEVKFWGEVLKRMQKDENYKFVWSAIPYEIFDKFSKPVGGKESAASMFTQCIKDTDFGMVMVEESRGELSVSLRSRTGFDVSKIAKAIGGGGHNNAAGGKVAGLPFDEAVEKILKISREVVDENKKKN